MEKLEYPASSLLPGPGSRLPMNFVVADGSRLAGTVFVQRASDGLPDSWHADLEVTGDPIQVFESYAKQIRELLQSLGRPLPELEPDRACKRKLGEVRCFAEGPAAQSPHYYQLRVNRDPSIRRSYVFLRISGRDLPSPLLAAPSLPAVNVPPQAGSAAVIAELPAPTKRVNPRPVRLEEGTALLVPPRMFKFGSGTDAVSLVVVSKRPPDQVVEQYVDQLKRLGYDYRADVPPVTSHEGNLITLYKRILCVPECGEVDLAAVADGQRTYVSIRISGYPLD
ncbi:MAG TPA: hypothetical protein VNE62_06095 [Actinomycetota bacterium]|nr:hypothetical protein [Actinomycetota bacterium]